MILWVPSTSCPGLPLVCELGVTVPSPASKRKDHTVDRTIHFYWSLDAAHSEMGFLASITVFHLPADYEQGITGLGLLGSVSVAAALLLALPGHPLWVHRDTQHLTPNCAPQGAPLPTPCLWQLWNREQGCDLNVAILDVDIGHTWFKV